MTNQTTNSKDIWGATNRDPKMDRPLLNAWLVESVINLQKAGNKEPLRAAFETMNVYRNCITCCNFIEHMGVCNLNGLVPPPRIVAYGCECHSDEVPY